MLKNRCKHMLLFVLVLVMVFAMAAPAFATDAADTMAQDVEAAKAYIEKYAFFDVADGLDAADTLEEIVALLQKNDKWARMYDAETYGTYMEVTTGYQVGIGIVYSVDSDGRARVEDLVPDSPAAISEIRVGDIITHVDGQALMGMGLEEIQETFKGERNTMVTVTTERNGVATETVMVRTKLPYDTVEYAVLPSGYGYIAISSFTDYTAEQFSRAVAVLQNRNVEGLVIDLRENLGGTLTGAVQMSGVFVDEEVALYIINKEGQEEKLGDGREPAVYLPMVMLVNENSASASEILAANFQDAEAGAVVGTKTRGKGYMQNLFELPSGAGIVFTTHKFLSNARQDIALNGGVTPDIVEEDPDKQLAVAQHWLDAQPRIYSIRLTMDSKYMYIGRNRKEMLQAPLLENGKSFLPSRPTLQALGYEIGYHDGMVTILDSFGTITVDLATLRYTMGEQSGETGGRFVNGTLYLPASFYRDVLNAEVIWDAKTDAVSITLTKNQ